MAEAKLTLGDLRKKYNEIHHASICMSDVAQLAHVSIGDVYTTESGGFVSKHIVEKVVYAFSVLSHQNIRIQDITVHITDMTPQTLKGADNKKQTTKKGLIDRFMEINERK